MYFLSGVNPTKHFSLENGHFLILSLAIFIVIESFYLVAKWKSLTAKIGKLRKTHFDRIDSRTKNSHNSFLSILFHFLSSIQKQGAVRF